LKDPKELTEEQIVAALNNLAHIDHPNREEQAYSNALSIQLQHINENRINHTQVEHKRRPILEEF